MATQTKEKKQELPIKPSSDNITKIDKNKLPKYKLKNYHKTINEAAENGNLIGLIYMIENKKADISTIDSWTLLWVIQYGYIEIIKYLHKKGVDIRMSNDSLLRFSVEAGQLEIFKYLVKNGADANIYYDLPLRLSAMNGHLPFLKFLVEQCNADIHANDDDALINSVLNSHVPVIKYLLARGANVRVLKYTEYYSNVCSIKHSLKSK